MFKKLWDKIPPILKNKYLITGVAFVVWMVFLDRNNLFTQYKLRKELHNLKNESQFYRSATIADSIEFYKVMHDSAALEKLGREKYLMKRDSEDIFLIVRKPEVK